MVDSAQSSHRFLNQSLATRWKLFVVGHRLVVVVLACWLAWRHGRLSSLSWEPTECLWLPLTYQRITWQLSSLLLSRCWAARQFVLLTGYRIDWEGNQRRLQPKALSVLDLLVVTGLVAGLFVLTNLQGLIVSEAYGSVFQM